METAARPSCDAEAGARRGEATQIERDSEPELVPVAASVFDDDFFRSASARNRAADESEIIGSAVADTGRECDSSDRGGNVTRLFAGASSSAAEHPETDELDIPAFLRRSR